MNKFLSPINIVFLSLVFALFLFGLFTIPGETMVPMHWNIKGQVDLKIPASMALWVGPLECILAIVVIFGARSRMGKDEAMAGKSLMDVSLSIAFAAGLFIESVVVLSASGWLLNMPQLAVIFIGIILLIIGNYLPKSQANRAAGIRFPWTLNSPSVWAKTHQFAGKCFMLAGLLIVFIGIINLQGSAAIMASMLVVLLAVVAVTLYSYSIRETNQ